MRVLTVACLLALAGHASSGRAEPAEAPRPDLPALQAGSAPGPLAPEPVRSGFWQPLLEPSFARAEQLVRQGRAQLFPALGLGLLLGTEVAQQRRVSVDNALARFQRAVALAPDHREARFLYAKALGLWEEQRRTGEVALKSAEAIAQLEALRALDPLYEADEVAFQLGILYTRQGDFARAIAEYERSLALQSSDEGNATRLANLAEVTMMSGDLVRALARYERATLEGDDGSRLLALWGTAIALDRLGEHGEALERARRAIREDRAPLHALRQSGVFFVPPYELHYYEGLGYLALADGEREANEPLEVLVSRARTWLAQPAHGALLLPLEPVLAELGEGDHRALVAPLRASLARVPRVRRAERASRFDDSTPPQAREARVMLWVLRSLAAFSRYLAQDRDQGPFAEDARDHLSELARTLAPK